jgi:geranylgeranyl diphosphate synthase type II
MSERAPAALDYSSLAAFLGGASAWVEAELARWLPEGEPRAFLYDLVRDYPRRGGKHFRPALLLLSCALGGGDPRLALPSAAALELFHNFALVHDDIEDDSLMRRGRATLHRLHGRPLALNAGDTLFALTYEALAENEHLLGAEAAWRVQREFQTMVRRTLEGQALDIGWIARNHLPSRAEYETMIRGKTGWYSGRGPCRIGALIGAAHEALMDTLGELGERLGIGFQIRDDLLNLAPDSSVRAPAVMAGGYGKERGGDLAEGKRTLIVIEMLERLRAAEGERLRQILVKPPADTTADEIEWAIDRAQGCGALEAVRAYAEALARDAEGLLERLPATPQRELLRELLRYLMTDRAA